MAARESRRCTICNLVTLRRMARLWSKLAGGTKKAPADVPPGHVAITVGNAGRRFVIRATYLNHPVFKRLLEQADEEYGHHQQGPLALPCTEMLFEEIIQSLRSGECRNFWHCSSQLAEEAGFSSWRDTRPLLHGFSATRTW